MAAAVAPPVRAAAATIPDVSVALVGRPTQAFVAAAIHDALVRALAPGTILTVAPPTLPDPLGPGLVIEAPIRVHAVSPGAPPSDGFATAHVTIGDAIAAAPVTLLYSDDPERFAGSGILFRSTILAARPSRLYVYHLPGPSAAGAWLRVSLAVDGGGTSRVLAVGRLAGPNPEVMFVGQTASYRLLDDVRRGAGLVAQISAGTPFVLASVGPLSAGALVAGGLDLAVLSGAPITATVYATTDPAWGAAALRPAPPDGHHRIGRYPLADPTAIDLRLATNGPAPAPVTVGGRGQAIENADAGGRPLVGGYGVVSPVRLRLANATAAPRRFYLFEQPSGSPVTTTLALDGDPTPIEVPCVRTAGNRYLVRTFVVPRATATVVTGSFTTDGGSSYPLRFGLSFDAPYAPPASSRVPDGCFPKP